MVPEKKAAARRSGLRGHHSTWNAQLSAEGSYDTYISNYQKSDSSVHTSPMISDVCGFQHKARLSLPQDNNRSASCLHQDNESTPSERCTHWTNKGAG